MINSIIDRCFLMYKSGSSQRSSSERTSRKRWSNVGLLLFHPVRHWPNIKQRLHTLVWHCTWRRAVFFCILIVFLWNEWKWRNLLIFSLFRFARIWIFQLFTKSRIRELSISMIGSAHYNNFRGILKFANLSSSWNSWRLKPREYYQIYGIRGIT